MTICLVCKNPTAKEIELRFLDGKTYRCPKDGEFNVSDSVLQTPKHMNASTAEWEAALQRAKEKAARGARPRILTYHFDSRPQSN